MPKVPRITEAEWKVMRVLWADPSPRPAYDVIERLAKAERWQPKTVKTLLTRLVKKRALGYRKYKNLYLYHPLIGEAACLEAESESFLRRYFGGSLQPMLLHFVEQRRLSPGQIEELKGILDRRRV